VVVVSPRLCALPAPTALLWVLLQAQRVSTAALVFSVLRPPPTPRLRVSLATSALALARQLISVVRATTPLALVRLHARFALLALSATFLVPSLVPLAQLVATLRLVQRPCSAPCALPTPSRPTLELALALHAALALSATALNQAPLHAQL